MPVRVQENVFWFQVSIRNVLDVVEELHDEDDFGCVETRYFLVELFVSAQIAEDFSTRAIVKLDSFRYSASSSEQPRWTNHHVQAITVRKAGDEGDDERMTSDLGQSISLVLDVLDLFELDD